MSYHRASDHPRSFRIPPPSPPTHSSDTSSSGWSTPELLEFDLDSPANEPSPLDTIIHSLDERLRTLDRRRSVIKGPRSPRVPAAALSAAPLPSAPACFDKLSDVAQALVTYQNSLSTPTLVSSASSRHQLRFAVESLLELAIGISETSLQPSTILEACVKDEQEDAVEIVKDEQHVGERAADASNFDDEDEVLPEEVESGIAGRFGQATGGGHMAGKGFEDATLAPRSETGWAPSVVAGAPTIDPDSPAMVQREVKALLNKLTFEPFESISNQILEWADKSVNETDGRILRQVVNLIFEKATDEANFSEMYARLCRKLMEKVSVNVKDETVKASDGTPVAGGALFRKYLLNRCQEDYENGWKAKESAAAAAADKAADDNAKKEVNDAAEAAAKEGKESSDSSAPKEAELLSDEYYAAQKAKRRGLGLVRFIGELYRLQMLTERIIHECIKKLLVNTENPDEEDIESLCRLLTTVGKGLDNPKAKQHMDIYFSRMRSIADNPKLPSRMRFMILDVSELRSERWVPRNESSGPKLISEIHSDAQKAADEASRRVASSGGKGLPRLGDQLSRPNSRRGQGRDQFGMPATGADGWSAPVPQRPAKAGDLSPFGKIRESSSAISLGPSGAFAKRAKEKKDERPSTPSNPFALLSGGAEDPLEAMRRRRSKLVLTPRSKPLEEEGEGEEGEFPGEEFRKEEEVQAPEVQADADVSRPSRPRVGTSTDLMQDNLQDRLEAMEMLVKAQHMDFVAKMTRLEGRLVAEAQATEERLRQQQQLDDERHKAAIDMLRMSIQHQSDISQLPLQQQNDRLMAVIARLEDRLDEEVQATRNLFCQLQHPQEAIMVRSTPRTESSENPHQWMSARIARIEAQLSEDRQDKRSIDRRTNGNHLTYSDRVAMRNGVLLR